MPRAASPAALFATFDVDRTDDNAGATACTGALNDCSLRGAIIAANANGVGADTINLPAGTYTLTLAGINEDLGATGDLDITSNITIAGAGAASTIIQAGTTNANGIDRVFDLNQ